MTKNTELLAIESQPAVLTVNFEEVRAALEKRVAQYDIVVTADSVADAKKLATELNKQKNEIEAKRKAAVADVSAPIKAFDGQMKKLSGLFEEGRQKILVQVQRFEDETREAARSMLHELRAKLWESQDIAEEFRRAEYDDLVMVTAVTKAGNLAASAKNPLEQRVAADKALQDRTKMRLMALENRSYKAGLKAPLTRDHVEHFLFAEDADYESSIERILTTEVARQAQIEQQERDRAERQRRWDEAAERRRAEEEAERKARAEQESEYRTPPREKCDGNHGGPPCADPECWNDEFEASDSGHTPGGASGAAAPDHSNRPPEAPESSGAVQPPRPAPTGKYAWNVHCEFRIECSNRVTKEAIEEQLRKVMEKAGITTLRSVQAVRQKEAA